MRALSFLGRRAILALSLLSLGGATSPAHAQTPDGKPLRLIVPSFLAQGSTLTTTTPEQARHFFVSELEKHRKLVKRSGAVAE
ncbi:MAG TPA: hypothetical protein VGQ93_10090 [Lysobacter sp.]|jgi:hypothetical protein|nr:hypothetical protein [Lysobacter sp.]